MFLLFDYEGVVVGQEAKSYYDSVLNTSCTKNAQVRPAHGRWKA